MFETTNQYLVVQPHNSSIIPVDHNSPRQVSLRGTPCDAGVWHFLADRTAGGWRTIPRIVTGDPLVDGFHMW